MGPAADGSAFNHASVNNTVGTSNKIATGASHTYRTMSTSRSTLPNRATCHLPDARLPVSPDHRTTVPGHYQVKALSAKIAAVTAIFGSNGAIYGGVISSSQRVLQL